MDIDRRRAFVRVIRLLPLRVLLLAPFLVLFAPPVSAFQIGDAYLHNSLGLFVNDHGHDYRLSYFGHGRYKRLFTKIIYRADHSSGFKERPFYTFKPGLGLSLYGPFSLRYQHERKRIVGRRVITTDEDRVGASIDLKRSLFGGKLRWSDDLIVYLYESESDQQLRWIANLRSWRVRATNILLLDLDHGGDFQDLKVHHFNLLEVSFQVYKLASLRFQFQSMSDQDDVYRLGLGIDF